MTEQKIVPDPEVEIMCAEAEEFIDTNGLYYPDNLEGVDPRALRDLYYAVSAAPSVTEAFNLLAAHPVGVDSTYYDLLFGPTRESAIKNTKNVLSGIFVGSDFSGLDIGTGTGLSLAAFEGTCSHITAIDESDLLTSAQKRLEEMHQRGLIQSYQLIRGDVVTTTYDTAPFDIAVDLGTTTYLSDEEKLDFTINIGKQLKPGGVLVWVAGSSFNEIYVSSPRVYLAYQIITQYNRFSNKKRVYDKSLAPKLEAIRTFFPHEPVTVPFPDGTEVNLLFRQ